MLVSKAYGDTSMDIPKLRKLKPTLKKFLKRFDGCFPRKDTRAHLPTYVSGQLSDIPEKSVEPIAIMYRKDDPDFAAVVDRTFSRLAQSRELVQLYNKWFQQRLPTGERLDLPMSPQLEEIFRVQGVPE